jgi:hypothetical protein
MFEIYTIYLFILFQMHGEFFFLNSVQTLLIKCTFLTMSVLPLSLTGLFPDEDHITLDFHALHFYLFIYVSDECYYPWCVYLYKHI